MMHYTLPLPPDSSVRSLEPLRLVFISGVTPFYFFLIKLVALIPHTATPSSFSSGTRLRLETIPFKCMHIYQFIQVNKFTGHWLLSSIT